MTATTPLTCDGFANALAAYLERDDTPRVRAAVETHAASCAECGALLADLQQLRVDAGGLPTLTPSRDLWAGIAERIETPVVALSEVRGTRPSVHERRQVPAWVRPAAAAAALVAITAGVTYFATREALEPRPQFAVLPVDSVGLDGPKAVPFNIDTAKRATSLPTRIAPSEPSDRRGERGGRDYAAQSGGAVRGSDVDRAPAMNVSTAAPAAAIETVYGREIARLWRIVDERRSQLDTATVGVLERNLNIIDQAIRESRAALARDPASAFLNEQLNNVLEQKVELLRAAALLPARS